MALSQLLYLSIRGNIDRRRGGATVARPTPVQKVACSNHVYVSFFYQFFRVDAFDIILIVISVYARKRHYKVAQW